VNSPNSARKRIVHLTSVHSPFDVRIFHKQCVSLAEHGYEVILLAPHHQNEFSRGVSIRAVPKPGGRLGRMTLTSWRLFRKAIALKPDLIHFHDPELIPVGVALAARGAKVIYDIHEDVPADILDKQYLPRQLRPWIAGIINWLETLSASSFSALIPVTETIAERFLPWHHNIVEVCNYPILGELASSSGRKRDRKNAIVYIGGIDEAKGLRQIVRAVSLVSADLSPILWLAGPYSSQAFRDELAHIPGWERVEEAGTLNRPALRDLLSTVRAGLVLFQPVPNNVRAQPNKLFEYMSAGLPVIASDFPLWRKIVDRAQCGLLVDPSDPAAIAKAIEYIFTHPEQADEMGQRGLKAVNELYNWNAEKQKLFELYQQILEGGRKREITVNVLDEVELGA
jgi:glycosyltransferase involved in cell wall biosynthesis